MNDKVVIDGEINLSNMIDGEPQHWVGASGIEAEPLSVTENGTYTAPSGVAYTPVEVNVPGIIPEGTIKITENADGTDVYSYAYADVNIPEPPVGNKNITANGTYNAEDDDLFGYSRVVVDVQPPLMEKKIVANGDYYASSDGVYGFSRATVNVPNPPVGTKNITANGTYSASDDSLYGFSSVNVNVPMWWVADSWEKLSNCWNETTTLKAVGFDSWTASNTSTVLRAGDAATPFAADMANYDYLIRWRFLWTAAYKAGATLTAIPVNGATDMYQFVSRRPMALTDVRSNTFNQNTYALFYSMLYQEYYNTSSNHVINWGNAYGITVTAVAPSYSSGDSITITPNYPTINARCNNSYFNMSRKADIDSEHSQIRLVGEVYRAKRSALRQTYEDMVNMVNSGL